MRLPHCRIVLELLHRKAAKMIKKGTFHYRFANNDGISAVIGVFVMNWAPNAVQYPARGVTGKPEGGTDLYRLLDFVSFGE
jgi:hypothetical protein